GYQPERSEIGVDSRAQEELRERLRRCGRAGLVADAPGLTCIEDRQSREAGKRLQGGQVQLPVLGAVQAAVGGSGTAIERVTAVVHDIGVRPGERGADRLDRRL